MKKLTLILLPLILLALASPALAADITADDIGTWAQVAATLIVPAASALANLTKTDKDNRAVGWFSRVVNILALNFKRSGL